MSDILNFFKNITKNAYNFSSFLGKVLILGFIGGVIYYILECIWRGYSHISMFILGGLCFVIIGLINEIFVDSIYIEQEIIIGWLAILILEFITGCIVNLWLGLDVWDYSDQPFNILGQVCPLFALLWIPITIFAIFFDDIVRYNLFNESKHKHKSYIVNKFKNT